MRVASVLACACLALACAQGGGELAANLGLPGTSRSARALLIAERGPYLDSEVDIGARELRFFFPDTPSCRSLLDGELLQYANEGPWGQLRRDQTVCSPTGILSLRIWRDSKPRPQVATPVPRDTARYEVVYSDEELLLARGRFRLAGLVGWSGGVDTVAILPNAPDCSGLVTATTATMEYRASGPEVYFLRDDRRRCQVIGFAQPVESGAP